MIHVVSGWLLSAHKDSTTPVNILSHMHVRVMVKGARH